MNGPPGDDERHPSGELERRPNVELPGSDNHILPRPTILDLCSYVERDTARVLSQADDIQRTAAFIENTLVDELREAIRRARDFATVERIWTAA